MSTIKEQFFKLLENNTEYELLDEFKASNSYVKFNHDCGLKFRTRPIDFVAGHRCFCFNEFIKANSYKAVCEKCESEYLTTIEQEKNGRVWCSEHCKDLLLQSRCKTCDKIIYSKNRVTFCSDKCRERPCSGCGEIFTFKGNPYCSQECFNKMHTYTCKGCGNKFIHKLKKSYCSPSCKLAIQALKENTFICKTCKTPFTTRRFLENFCSDKCRLDFKPRITSPKNNAALRSNLRDIISFKVIQLIEGRRKAIMDLNNRIDYRYISGFTPQLRAEVKNRDDNKCFICDNIEHLEVHHIVPKRLGGSHVQDNLITLCRKCHRYIETGNEEHAIRKCLESAEKHYGIYIKSLEKYDKNYVKPAIIQVIKDLESLYDKISESDLEEEVLTKFNDAIDELNDVLEIKK